MADDRLGSDERLTHARTVLAAPLRARRSPVSEGRNLGRQLYLAGQVAQRGDELVAVGRVGDEIDLELARACARQCALNLLDAAATELGTLGLVRSVVRLAVYVASAPGFVEQHLVADAASDVFAEVLGGDPPVRVALGVASLPLGSPVEVDAVLDLAASEER